MVCGHLGVFSFDSPEYEISEGSGSIRINVRRSGGGVGSVSVAYMIEHESTSPSDVSPTAFYTTDQTLSFRHGEISISFLITIHDDQILVSLSPSSVTRILGLPRVFIDLYIFGVGGIFRSKMRLFPWYFGIHLLVRL